MGTLELMMSTADDKNGPGTEAPEETRAERRRRNRRYGEGKKRASKEAACPYCGAVLPRAHGIGITPMTGFRGGACSCGAIFLLDENGFHGGEAIVEVLTLLYGDWATAWNHEPGKDYDQTSVPYDERNHRIAEEGDVAKPDSVLYFALRRDREAGE